MQWQGELLHIHICESAAMKMEELAEGKLIAGYGIEGDRYATKKGRYSSQPDIREVTLIEIETLVALKRDHRIDLQPHEHRRNLTTRNVPLNHLVGRQFAVGEVILEGGRLNVPCKYLENLLNKPVFEPLKFRSGLNCRVIRGGIIRPGDVILPQGGEGG